MTEKKMSSSPSYVRLASFNEGKAAGSPRKGYVPVLVGSNKEDMERLCIPVKLINHPSVVSLLDDSVQAFGDNQQGLLRLSCKVDTFRELLKSLSRAK